MFLTVPCKSSYDFCYLDHCIKLEANAALSGFVFRCADGGFEIHPANAARDSTVWKVYRTFGSMMF